MRQTPLWLIGKAGVEHVGYDEPQHAVAQKLKPLVIRLASAAMSQRAGEQCRIGDFAFEISL